MRLSPQAQLQFRRFRSLKRSTASPVGGPTTKICSDRKPLRPRSSMAASASPLVAKMREIAGKESRPSFARDAGNIETSPAILVIGVAANSAGLNCGFCGKPTCEVLEGSGGVCTFNSIDLGIATASAAEVAGRFHLDNRVMYSIGRACLDLKMFDDKVRQALGIPLSVTGKNPFFDRKV